MRALLAALLLLALSACGRSQELGGKTGPSAAPETIATSTVLPPQTDAGRPSPDADASQYETLKVAARAFAAAEPRINTVESEDGAAYLDVVDCSEPDRARDPSGAETSPLEALARRVALLERSLREAGYPPAVYQSSLARYEADQLSRIQGGRAPQSEEAHQQELAELAASIDTARQRLRPDLPQVRAVGGCGAAESETIVRSDPSGGRVWLITQFAFDVCRARKIDPWDRIACSRWSEMDPSHPAALSGEYVYQARWPDGSSGRGTRQIAPGQDSDTPQVYTVRKD